MMDDYKCCSRCKRPLLPRGYQLSPQQRTIYQAVKERPRTPEQLRIILWGADPNGGPGEKTIHVIINQMNHKLKDYGVKVRAIGHRYYIVATHGDAVLKRA